MSSAIIIIMIASILLAFVLAAHLAYQLGGRRARQITSELTNLNELGRQLLRAQLDVDALCEMVYWQAGQIVPTALFQLGLFDGDAYEVKVWVRDSQRQTGAIFSGGGRKGIIGWVRESGSPLLVRDFEAERDQLPAFPEFDLADPPRSGVFVPLIAGSSSIGIIAIQSRQAGRFSEEHLRLLTGLANQAAWAVSNARLYERSQRRAEQLKLIGNVTAQMSAIQPLPDLFRQIVTLTKQTFGYYCVSIFMLEDRHLRMAASSSETFYRKVPLIKVGLGMIGWAAKETRTALANNVAEDPRYRKLGLLPETASEITLPLVAEGQVLGVVDIQSDQLDAFSDEDVFLLETLATQIALAIKQAQTYGLERRLSQRLEALIQVSQAVVSVLDLDELLDRVVDLIADTFGFKRAHIFLRTADRIVFRAGSGPHSVRWLIEELSYSLDERGLIPKAARTGEAAIVADVSTSQDYRPGPGVENTRAELVIPIKMGGYILGVIDLQSEQAGAFDSGDLVLMQSLADSVAVAIRNATLYANERRRRNLADTLRQISAALVSDLDLDRVLAGILEGLRDVISLEAAAILMVEEGGNPLTVMATSGAELEGIVGHHLPLDSLLTNDESDIREAVSRAYHALLDRPADHVCTIAPMVSGGTLVGYLIADHPMPSSFSHHDEEITLAFASQAAVAVNNARLYSAQQSDAWVTTVLLQVAEAVNAQASIDEALETIARLTALLAGVNYCLILRRDSVIQGYYLGARYPGRDSPGGAQVSQLIQTEHHPYLELLTVADRPLGAGRGHGLTIPEPINQILPVPSILGFPLRAQGEVIGLLLVDDPSYGAPLDPRLFNILTGIAHQSATALEVAGLHASASERDRLEQELQVARQIQSSFIPDIPPREPGWQIAAIWRAAHQVSGDFYDFIRLQNGLWGMVVADVADKGMPAALFMAMSRTLLRAAAASRTSPAATLVRVNELLFNDSRSDLFVTVLYAVWNPATGEVTYSSAGHNPPLLVRADGRDVEELRCHGIALGVLPAIELDEHRIQIAPGDALVAYTDGVTEAMRADYQEWGLARLRSSVARNARKGAKSLLDSILVDVDRHVGAAPQNDDLSVWVLKRESSKRRRGRESRASAKIRT